MPVRRREREPFAARLLRWFDRERRDLPWRRTRDPWAIWVSEVMLQQTRVEAVRAAFERFVTQYPTAAAFAAASDDELLLAWRGLGYYRRARLLRDGARAVVREHGGRVPSTVTELAELPGVGAYTCGAIASIAFGHGEIAVDGNVERVCARHRGVRERIDTGATRKSVRATVAGWLDRARPGDFNQALMELGAVVCTPSSPRCEKCPVSGDCVGFTTGDAAQLPVKKAPRAAVEVTARAVLVLGGDGALGHRLAADEANAGQIELPGPGVLVSAEPAELAAAVRARFGALIEVGPVIATVRHAITHHRIVLRAHAATVRRRGRLQWFPLGPDTPWTTPARKVFAAAIDGDASLRA
ncbi:MAG: A/G-specific adenine glycosylase [Planctomycetota bacterium]